MKVLEQNSPEAKSRAAEAGMSLIETTIALVIIMIALLGVVHSFTYAVTYNAGNAVRSEALAILQREVEAMRAAKWTSSGVAPIVEATGPTCDPVVTTFTSATNGGVFEVQRTVDDDPFTDGCQVDAATQLKEITVTVRPSLALAIRPDNANESWWFAVPATVVLRRTRGN